MRLPKISFASPDLRLVDSNDDKRDHANATPAPGADERSHVDLVSEVIGEAGLLAADKLEQVRKQAIDTSFSQALVDEGFASALGVAFQPSQVRGAAVCLRPGTRLHHLLICERRFVRLPLFDQRVAEQHEVVSQPPRFDQLPRDLFGLAETMQIAQRVAAQ